MPRPTKAADRRRSERFEIRLTIDEAHELVTRAISAGMSASDFLRKLAFGSDATMQTAAPDRAAQIAQLDELTKIGMVLSQIVRSGKYANTPEQAALLTEASQNIKTLSAHLIQKLSS